jgi:hypothetical protein
MTGVIVSPSRGDHPMSRQADSAVVDEVWRASNLADLGDQQSCCCITGLRSHQSTVLLFAQPYYRTGDRNSVVKLASKRARFSWNSDPICSWDGQAHGQEVFGRYNHRCDLNLNFGASGGIAGGR